MSTETQQLRDDLYLDEENDLEYCCKGRHDWWWETEEGLEVSLAFVGPERGDKEFTLPDEYLK